MMARGADLGVLEDNGANILKDLIHDEHSIQAINIVLDRQPGLVHFVDKDEDRVPILSLASEVGFPHCQTVA
jgi:hypothetical protein